jgi:predicted DNA-binding transcriptional regulator YafY
MSMPATVAAIADSYGPQWMADWDAMRETSARLLRLLSLLQAQPDWPGADLASRLEITARTLRRDVARLRDLGYPVWATPGVAGGYRLGAGAALPPLLLDDDEAVAVAVSLRAAASGSVTGIAETSLRALAKLEQVLPARLREAAATLREATVALPRHAATVDTDVLAALARACRGRQVLAFGYTSGDGTVSRRRAEPYRLVHAGARWYLVARDTGRDEWRTFRADRIAAPAPTGARFTRADPPDAAAFVARSVTTAPYRYQARLLVHAPLAAVADEIPPTWGTLTADGPDRCVLTWGANSQEVLALHAAMLPAPAVILEPPELVAAARELAAALGRLADGSH